jgi:hypothetical protein
VAVWRELRRIGALSLGQGTWAVPADCGKFDAAIDKEIRNRKFTMAELEEEEQSLERSARHRPQVSKPCTKCEPRWTIDPGTTT